MTPRRWTCCGWRPAPPASAGAADVAATYLRRALAEPPDATLSPELTLELGSSALAAGDIDTAVEQLSGAGRMPVSVTVRAAAAAELGTALTLTDRPAEAVRALTEAIQALPESERELGLFLQGTRCFTAASSLEAWRSLPDPADAVRPGLRPAQLAAGAHRPGSRRARRRDDRHAAAGAPDRAADSRRRRPDRRPRAGRGVLLDGAYGADAGRDARGGHRHLHRRDRLVAPARSRAGIFGGEPHACHDLVASRCAGRGRGGRRECAARDHPPRHPLRRAGAGRRPDRARPARRGQRDVAQRRSRRRPRYHHRRDQPPRDQGPARCGARTRGTGAGGVRHVRPPRTRVGHPHARRLGLALGRGTPAAGGWPPGRGRDADRRTAPSLSGLRRAAAARRCAPRGQPAARA